MLHERRLLGRFLPAGLAALFGLAAVWPAIADDAAPAAGPGTSSAGTGFFSDWFSISDAAKESQPHWMTPLVTVTPRLEEEFRYDQYWQTRNGDVQFENIDNGKGLEIIPLPNTEFILSTPAYEVKHTPKGDVSGWADETVLAKYRLLSENEEQGNYIVTGFLGYSLPTGNAAFTNNKGIITPTLAAGRGWGTRESGFDVQSTFGVGIPVADEKAVGTTFTWNTTLQAHIFSKLWPEIEANYTAYHDGEHAGKDQLAFTVGITVGRFELGPRARLIFGAGYEWPVSSFGIFVNQWLGTVRVAF